MLWEEVDVCLKPLHRLTGRVTSKVSLKCPEPQFHHL